MQALRDGDCVHTRGRDNCMSQHKEHTEVCVACRGLHAIASSAGMHLHVLDLEEGCCIHQVDDVASDHLALSPDGLHVACAAKNGAQITVYDIEQESMLLEFRCHLRCKEHGVRSLAWSAESNLLVSGGQDNKCKIWNV